MLFGIWLVFKGLRLISGNAMLFHDKTGKFNRGNSRGSEGHRSGGKLADGTNQGMIIL
jgi:hypothetical protein